AGDGRSAAGSVRELERVGAIEGVAAGDSTARQLRVVLPKRPGVTPANIAAHPGVAGYVHELRRGARPDDIAGPVADAINSVGRMNHNVACEEVVGKGFGAVASEPERYAVVAIFRFGPPRLSNSPASEGTLPGRHRGKGVCPLAIGPGAVRIA